MFDRVPRYVVQRAFDPMNDEAMHAVLVRSKQRLERCSFELERSKAEHEQALLSAGMRPPRSRTPCRRAPPMPL
jgi:hypothetical protein